MCKPDQVDPLQTAAQAPPHQQQHAASFTLNLPVPVAEWYNPPLCNNANNAQVVGSKLVCAMKFVLEV